MASKLITYGCSFTSYFYPTYSDLLSVDHNVTNVGRSGCGNEYIFYSLLSDLRNNKLNKYDAVIVQWSSVTRFDYKSCTGWIGNGNVYDNPKTNRIWKNIKEWYNPNFELEKTKNYMYSVKEILDANNITACYLSYIKNPFEEYNFFTLDNLYHIYKGNYIFEEGKTKHHDRHPTVLQHLDIAENIAKSLNIDVSDKARSCARIATRKIREGWKLGEKLELTDR
jgi:hypothetical protein